MAYVSERPPLRESYRLTTPGGRQYRWAEDERTPANVPSDASWSDTMPGGFETQEKTFARDPSVDYADIERLSLVEHFDAVGNTIWEGRLERAPQTSGDRIAISPSAVGWQAGLEDDKSAAFIGRDIDMTAWGPLPTDYRALLLGVPYTNIQDGQVTQVPDSAGAALQLSMQFSGTDRPLAGAMYDAGNARVGKVYAEWESSANWTPPTSRFLSLELLDSATVAGDVTSDSKRLPGRRRLTATTDDPNRLVRALWFCNAAAAAGQGINAHLLPRTLPVYGNHGLTLRGTEPDAGFYDADLIGYALSRWCPALTYTSESLTPDTSFIIPHFAFRDPTTVGEMVRQATRFSLRDWAVWEKKTFWLHDRGARGRRWIVRASEARARGDRPAGRPAVEQHDGRLPRRGRLVPAPPGLPVPARTSRAATLRIRIRRTRRRSSASSAVTCSRWGPRHRTGRSRSARSSWQEAKQLDSSGRARVVGHVQDASGVWHPYSHMRAGDEASFVDARDTSYRRLVRTQKTRSDLSCSFDLDAPPEGLQALLERLGVSLVRLGF